MCACGRRGHCSNCVVCKKRKKKRFSLFDFFFFLLQVHSLVFIDLVNCHKITDRSLLAIQGNCMHLMALALGGSNKISDPALREFRVRRSGVALFLHSNSSMSKAVSSSAVSAAKPAVYKAPKGGFGRNSGKK